MAAPFSVTAPLALRCPDGTRKFIAACFPHPLGLLYLDTTSPFFFVFLRALRG